ncbi:hypothetical protein Tco_1039942, partial [Tanacetum coccineum]
METELMLEEKFRDLCDEVSNFAKEIEDVVKEVELLSCKDVAKETVRLFRRGQKRKLYKMTGLQMMVNESHLSVREKHTFMHFLLSSMNVVYVLTTPIPEDGGDDATVEQIRKRAKWDNDDYVCRGLILN